MTSRLRLPQVTICSADSAYVDLTARALMRSMEMCEFGDAILFSDTPKTGPFRHITIPRLESIADYSAFCLKGMADHIHTSHVLLVQWDGFVVNPGAWTRAFLKEDYIGAVWRGVFEDSYRVGNGGFSLRSKKLLDTLKQFPSVPRLWEDQVICRLHRPRLEDDFGIRYATERVADRFSYELDYRDAFGFHGFANMWRYLDDDEMMDVARTVWRATFAHWKSVRLIVAASQNGRETLAGRLYRLLRDTNTYPAILQELRRNASFVVLPKTMETLDRLERSLDPAV